MCQGCIKTVSNQPNKAQSALIPVTAPTLAAASLSQTATDLHCCGLQLRDPVCITIHNSSTIFLRTNAGHWAHTLKPTREMIESDYCQFSRHLPWPPWWTACLRWTFLLAQVLRPLAQWGCRWLVWNQKHWRLSFRVQDRKSAPGIGSCAHGRFVEVLTRRGGEARSRAPRPARSESGCVHSQPSPGSEGRSAPNLQSKCSLLGRLGFMNISSSCSDAEASPAFANC